MNPGLAQLRKFNIKDSDLLVLQHHGQVNSLARLHQMTRAPNLQANRNVFERLHPKIEETIESLVTYIQDFESGHAPSANPIKYAVFLISRYDPILVQDEENPERTYAHAAIEYGSNAMDIPNVFTDVGSFDTSY